MGKQKNLWFYIILISTLSLVGFIYMSCEYKYSLEHSFHSTIPNIPGAIGSALIPFLIAIAFIKEKEKNIKSFFQAFTIGIIVFIFMFILFCFTENVNNKEKDKNDIKIQQLSKQYEDLVTQNKLEESLKTSDEILAIKDIPEAHFYKGHSAEGLKKYDLAIKEFTIVIDSKSNLSDYSLFHRGTIYLLLKKDKINGCNDIKNAESILMKPTTSEAVKEKYRELLKSCQQ